MLSSWADCVAKWVRAGKCGTDALQRADEWEAAHQEIDRRELQAMHEYRAGIVLRQLQEIESDDSQSDKP